VAGVAGARHRAEALATGAAAPGRPLTLMREPDNPHDPNAIAVHAGGQAIGFVPRELAEAIAPELDAGRAWSAVVLREQRASPRDPRTGVTMLLAPGDAIELRTRE
jgi:HIRAN domain